jgi:ribosome maturation factor RimP
MSGTDTPVVRRVREIVEPIASDLQLDVYDVEQRGGTMRVTLDTPPGSPGGVDLDQLALATRLISRELDHTDPVPGGYTLEVTSPGVERALRTPAHFQREIGKTIAIRLADVTAAERRIEGVLVAADDRSATVSVAAGNEIVERVVEIAGIDRARTVFVWGPQPKPGKSPNPKKAAARKAATKKPATKKAATKKAAARKTEVSVPDTVKESS